MTLFRTARTRSTSTAPVRSRRAVARALALAPTQESRHELVAQATRL